MSELGFRTVSVDIYQEIDDILNGDNASFRTVSVDIYRYSQLLHLLYSSISFRTVSVDIYLVASAIVAMKK